MKPSNRPPQRPVRLAQASSGPPCRPGQPKNDEPCQSSFRYLEDEVALLRLLAVRIIDDETAAEASSSGVLHQEEHLVVGLGVELKDSSSASCERCEERVEEAFESLRRRMRRRIGVAEPLQDRHADSTIESACSKAETLADVLQEEIALDFSIQRNRQHARTDITSAPHMSFLVQDLTAQS